MVFAQSATATVATSATLLAYLHASVATVAGVVVAIRDDVRFRQITFDSLLGDPDFDRYRVVRDRQRMAITRTKLFEPNAPATVATLATVRRSFEMTVASVATVAGPLGSAL